jgi:IclR family acetate operon transcriptional repressor
MSKPNNRVGAIETAHSTLEALKDLEGAGPTELSRHLDLPKSTVYNHLKTLEEAGFLVHEDDEYRLSFKFLNYGYFVRHQCDLYGVGKEKIDELAEETGEVSNLMAPEANQGVYLYKARGNRAVQHDTRPGKRVPLHTTAMGKSILSTYSDEEVREIIHEVGLEEKTPNTITEIEGLLEELQTIRQTGYATNTGERNERVYCVAAPINVENKTVLGGLSVSGPKPRMQDRLDGDLPEKVIEASNVIEINIKHQSVHHG